MMESLADKYYDLNTDLWDSDLGQTMSEVLKGGVDFEDWSPDRENLQAAVQAVVAAGGSVTEDNIRQTVVLHDRLMTDAVLCPPIKVEHSYSLTHQGVAAGGRESPGPEDNSPLTLSRNLHDMEDDDDECYPCISLDTATGRSERHNETEVIIQVKEEPMSDPGSPESFSSYSMSVDSEIEDFLPTPAAVRVALGLPLEKNGTQQSVLKQTSNGTRSSTRLTIKLEPGNGSVNGSGFSLPPTPPSSTNSDSESANGSSNVQNSPTSPPHPRPGRPPGSGSSARVYLGGQGSHNRQPIQTPLISSQPKGSTGILMLTEEEKRTLLAEGYKIPTSLPLSKSDEKSLKKIRRKIKNKISAQESRRKKKEYMDALERKVEVLSNENTECKKKMATIDETYKKKIAIIEDNYKKKLSNLEDNNTTLLSQLKQLKELVSLNGRSRINGLSRSTVK